MRVVIADDEKFVLVVLKSALRSVRFPIEIVGEALDGDDAYRLCCKKKPDLLITDICMPRKDGLDLLAKRRETQPELPVIIYSGFDNFSYAQKAIHYGVEEYLLKPIDEEKLERAISDVMQRRQMRSLRDKTQSRSRLLRRCLESIAPGVRQDAQRTGSGGEDEQQFLSGAAECTLFMLAVPGEREICETQWRVRLTERRAVCAAAGRGWPADDIGRKKRRRLRPARGGRDLGRGRLSSLRAGAFGKGGRRAGHAAPVPGAPACGRRDTELFL